MKSILLAIAVSTTILTAYSTGSAQTIDSTGLPGDHFSLEGALDLFKHSENPEAFEKALNTEDNYVNNLDLNEDGKIDYIRIDDYTDDDVHALVLQAVVGENEAQDVAVIEIEKTAENEAILQIIGDEDLYGEETIVEPFEEEDGKGGPSFEEDRVRLVVNVWLWPSVRYLYRPGYVRWVSPWRWMLYPNWWSPWRVHPFRYMMGVRPRYHLHYHPVVVHRVGRAHGVYAPRRTTSVIVHNHYHGRVTNYRAQKGITNTKKTTVIQGPRGGRTVIHQDKATGVRRNSDGTARRVQHTDTKVVRKNPEGDRTAVSRKTTKVGGKKADGSSAGAKRSTTKVRKTSTKKTKRTPRKH